MKDRLGQIVAGVKHQSPKQEQPEERLIEKQYRPPGGSTKRGLFGGAAGVHTVADTVSSGR